MKRFVFRLQAALEHRQRREEQLRTELAEIQNRRFQEVRTLEELVDSQDRLMRRIAETRIGRLEPETLWEQEQQLATIEDEIEAQTEIIALIQQELDQKIQEVVIATQETKVMEKLRERHLDEHRKAELREEQKFLDELASIRSARQRAEA